jgi:hypothetical protein
MFLLFLPGLVLAFFTSCQLPPERLPLMPLPEDGPPLPFADAMTRARAQAMAGTEAFYVNRWGDLEDAARALEQTARFLPKATDIPAQHRDTLPVQAGDLGKDAVKLREAAKSRDVKTANDLLQRIHLKVRELRPEMNGG